MLSGLSLGSLLGTLPEVPTGNASAPASSAGSVLGDLPGVPGLAGLADDLAGGLLSGNRTASEHTTLPEGKAGQVVVLQLTVGELSKEVTATGVHAKAASLRVKVLTRSKWAGHKDDDGYGIADNTALVDFGLCVLEAAAATEQLRRTAATTVPTTATTTGATAQQQQQRHRRQRRSRRQRPTPVAPAASRSLAAASPTSRAAACSSCWRPLPDGMARKRTAMVARKRSVI